MHTHKWAHVHVHTCWPKANVCVHVHVSTCVCAHVGVDYSAVACTRGKMRYFGVDVVRIIDPKGQLF